MLVKKKKKIKINLQMRNKRKDEQILEANPRPFFCSGDMVPY